MKPETFESYLSRAFDGDLNTEEFQLFEEHLAESKEAREHYLEFADLTNLIDLELQHLAPSQSDSSDVINMSEVLKRQNKRSFYSALLATVALLIIGGFLLSLIFLPSEPSASYEMSPGTVFNITHPEDSDITGNTIIIGSEIEVSQGAVELILSSGVKAIITAPAQFMLTEKDTQYLDHGTAWFEVPEGAEGFTVNSKRCEVIDFGTEFGIISHNDQLDEVHLFKGEIKVKSLLNLEREEILKGQSALQIDPIRRLITIPLNEKSFDKTLPKTHDLPIKWCTAIKASNLSDISDSSAPTISQTAKDHMSLNGSFPDTTLINDGDTISVTGEVSFKGINSTAHSASLNFGIFQNNGNISQPMWSGYRITCSSPEHESRLRRSEKNPHSSPAVSYGDQIWISKLGKAYLKENITYYFSFTITQESEGLLIQSSFNDGDRIC